MDNTAQKAQLTGEVIFDSPIVIVEKVKLRKGSKYRFHQLINGQWHLTGQSSSWKAIEEKELDLDQQEDLELGIIIPTQRADIPFIRAA